MGDDSAFRDLLGDVFSVNMMQDPSPTIAIRSFQVIGEDAEDDAYFALSFGEDLVTELSRFANLRVVAGPWTPESRDSTAHPPDFVLRGSIRRDADTLRVSAQFIESSTSHHLWADRFDVPVDHTLEVQDGIVQAISTALALRVDESRLKRTHGVPESSLDAYDLWLRGREYLLRGTVEDDLAAREFFNKALKIDPSYARAHAGLSLSYYNDWSCQNWHLWEESESEAFKAARRAVELERRDPLVHCVLGRIHLYRREWDLARSHYDHALSLNSVDPEAIIHVALGMAYLGECDTALSLTDRAIDLYPAHHRWYYGCKAIPLFAMGDDQAAVQLVRQANQAFVDLPAFESAALSYLGETDAARHSADVFLSAYRTKIRFGGEFSPDEPVRWLAQVNPFRDERHAERLFEGLRRAGLGSLPPGHRPSRSDAEIRPADLGADNNAFQRQGELWCVAFAGKAAHLVGVKGFEDISRLLARPEQPIHSAELMGVTSSLSDADGALDADARRALDRRIRELRDEVAAAERANDPGRAETASGEISQIAAELSRSLGLGGRSRKLGDPAERARSAVTWRIRSAIKKLRAAHPELGQHLAKNIRTGTFCVYEPREAIDWEL